MYEKVYQQQIASEEKNIDFYKSIRRNYVQEIKTAEAEDRVEDAKQARRDLDKFVTVPMTLCLIRRGEMMEYDGSSERAPAWVNDVWPLIKPEYMRIAELNKSPCDLWGDIERHARLGALHCWRQMLIRSEGNEIKNISVREERRGTFTVCGNFENGENEYYIQAHISILQSPARCYREDIKIHLERRGVPANEKNLW